MRRILSFLLAVFIAWGSVTSPARAAVPLLLVATTADLASGLVIRQVGKQMLIRVGVAANDASWLPTVATWAARAASYIGVGPYSTIGGSEQYAVPLLTDSELPKGNFPTSSSGAISALSSGGMVFTGSYSCWSNVTIPAASRTAQQFAEACTAAVDAAGKSVDSTDPQHPYQVTPFTVVERNDDYAWDFYVSGVRFKGMNLQPYDCAQWPGTHDEVSCSENFGAKINISASLVEGKDGIKRFKVCGDGSGTGYCADLTDPDWSDQEKSDFASPSALVWRGVDANGRVIRADVGFENGHAIVQGLGEALPQAVTYRRMNLNTDAVVQEVVEKVAGNATADTFYENNPSLSVSSGASSQTSSGTQTNVETCGLPGKAACVIDDSGFTDKDNFSSSKNQEVSDKLDEARTNFEKLKDSKPEVDKSWLPSLKPGPVVSCQAIKLEVGISHGPLAGVSGSADVDICDKADLFRQIMAWLFGVGAVLYIWRTFTGARQS